MTCSVLSLFTAAGYLVGTSSMMHQELAGDWKLKMQLVASPYRTFRQLPKFHLTSTVLQPRYLKNLSLWGHLNIKKIQKEQTLQNDFLNYNLANFLRVQKNASCRSSNKNPENPEYHPWSPSSFFFKYPTTSWGQISIKSSNKNKLDFCSEKNHHLKVEPILAEISGAVA